MATKAVIIGTSDVIRLCTARAVGAAGYGVDIVRIGRNKGKMLKTSDFFCKYVEDYFYFDETGPVTLPEFLIEKYQGCGQKPVLFSLSDKVTHIIDDARSRLEAFFLFAHLKDGNSLSGLMDKNYMKTRAAAVGLSVVQGWPIMYEDGEFSVPDQIEYPCYVKGLYSYWDSKPIQRKCEDKSELEALTRLCKTVYPHPLYAEEFVKIKREMGMMGICDGENCWVPAETELVLMGEGSSHGVSILGHVKPVRTDNEIKRKIETLLKGLGFVGIFNIDFIETEGRVFFVELNLRFATYGYGLFKLGVNVPALFIQILTNSLNPDSVPVVEKDQFYLNEEVAFNNILEGKLSVRRFEEIKKQAGIYFVQSAGDPRPMKHLRRRFVIKYLLKLKRRIVK